MLRRSSDVVEHAARFRLAHHVRAGVGLVVGILVLEVAVEVDAAGRVLVVEAVAVVVDAFPVDRVAAALAPLRIGAAHQARDRRDESCRARADP